MPVILIPPQLQTFASFGLHLLLILIKQWDLALLRPNKKMSVFRVTGLKILGRVCTHIFFLIIFFLEKKYNFMHFERHLAFQNA